MAGVHLCMALPNALIQEMVRAYIHGWYQQLVTALPHIENGYVYAPEQPGLGIDLKPELLTRSDVSIESSEL